MDELISKRELLETYKISYGALYRWKRMGLIPEEWFIRRSTPTGQETFFNRERICARMDEIMQRKDDASLRELAAGLAEKPSVMLTVKTRYGESRFDLSEVESVVAEYPTGHKISIELSQIVADAASKIITEE